FTRFQDHVADESVAHDHFNRIFEKMTAFDIAAEVERSLLQHLKDFLRLFSSFHVLLAQRNQTDPWAFVTKNVARINRTHDRVLQKMFGACIDIGAGVDQDENVKLCGSTAAMIGRSIPSSVRKLIVLAGTSAPV